MRRGGLMSGVVFKPLSSNVNGVTGEWKQVWMRSYEI